MEWPIVQKSIILNKINGLGDVFEKIPGCLRIDACGTQFFRLSF
jgi:hypothetical protein